MSVFCVVFQFERVLLSLEADCIGFERATCQSKGQRLGPLGYPAPPSIYVLPAATRGDSQNGKFHFSAPRGQNNYFIFFN